MHSDTHPRILFVDDDCDILDALQRKLRPFVQKWDMTFRDDADQALTDQRQHPFDVVVTDMSMPKMTGIALIRAMRDLCPDTVCIILTGAADLRTAIDAINEANAFRFYTKPCAIPVLTDGIGEALDMAAENRRQKWTASGNLSHLGTMALDRLPLGVVVVDGRASILFSNSRGAQLLAAGDGLVMDRGGLCRTTRPSETLELHRLIRDSIQEDQQNSNRDGHGTTRALSVSRQGDDRPLSVLVAPLTGPAGDSGGAAVLIVGDPNNRMLPSADTVARLFDLSDTEARLAVAMAEGLRIEEAAASLGVTVSSARTYLKRVFLKTGVDRQAELVALVMSAPALLDLRRNG